MDSLYLRILFGQHIFFINSSVQYNWFSFSWYDHVSADSGVQHNGARRLYTTVDQSLSATEGHQGRTRLGHFSDERELGQSQLKADWFYNDITERSKDTKEIYKKRICCKVKCKFKYVLCK